MKNKHAENHQQPFVLKEQKRREIATRIDPDLSKHMKIIGLNRPDLRSVAKIDSADKGLSQNLIMVGYGAFNHYQDKRYRIINDHRKTTISWQLNLK